MFNALLDRASIALSPQSHPPVQHGEAMSTTEQSELNGSSRRSRSSIGSVDTPQGLGKTGWVYKLSNYLRVWRRRYAFIKNDYELHFATTDIDGGSESHVFVDLRKCKTIRKTKYDSLWSTIENVIEIPHDGETLYMYPEIVEEIEEWVVTLKNRILNANIGFSLWQAANDGSLSTVNSIIGSIPGVDVNYSTDTGETVLYAAAAAGRSDVVKLLISDAGADANKANKDGVTPLHIAVFRGFEDVVHVLIDSAASEINQATFDKQLTALHIAADTQRAGIAKALINAGADINACAANDWTALSYAVANQDVEMTLILLDTSPDLEIGIQPGNVTPLHTAVECGNKDILYLLLEANANVNAANDTDETMPIHVAVKERFLDIARALIAAGADPEPPCSRPEQPSPLFLAILNNDLEMVRLVLSAGAKVNRVDAVTNMSALSTAMAHGYNRVADALVEAGASQRQLSKQSSSDEESYGSFG